MNKGQRIGVTLIVSAMLYCSNQNTLSGLIFLFIIFMFILKGHDKTY